MQCTNCYDNATSLCWASIHDAVPIYQKYDNVSKPRKPQLSANLVQQTAANNRHLITKAYYTSY